MVAFELGIPATYLAVELMRSEVVVEARVCDGDGEVHESDADSMYCSPNLGEFKRIVSDRGTSNYSNSSFHVKMADTESCGSDLLSRLAMKDVSMGRDYGTTSSSIALKSVSEGKRTQMVPRNGSGSFKKHRMLQTNNLSAQAEAGDTDMESDKLGMHLVKCSYSDKPSAIKQKHSTNGRRGDKKKDKVQMKAKCDPFSLKTGLPSFIRASGGGSPFGMYGLKSENHDVTKFIDDIKLEDLLDISYKLSTQGRDEGKKAAHVGNENIIDLVRKACSILQSRGLQHAKQTEELGIDVNRKLSLASSPSRTSTENVSDGDGSSLTAGLSLSSKDQEFCTKAETPVDMNDPLQQPKDVLERLALPPRKDLDSLLRDAVKPAASAKLTDLRSGKILSHHITLPPFSWSNNFNGHCKSSSDSARISSKNTCNGRWVRIRDTAGFSGGGNESFMDLESLSYDDSLVPASQLKYRLPDTGKMSSTFISMDHCQQDPSSAVSSTASLLPCAPQSPEVLAAAGTLFDIASHCPKPNLNERIKLPRQPSRETKKVRSSRFCEKTQEAHHTSKSEKSHDHVLSRVEGGSSKKPKVSDSEKIEDYSHVQPLIGQSSAFTLRSNTSSPSRLSRNSFAETRHSNGSFMKPSFTVAPPKAPDKSNYNPPKMRKVGSVDWNRTRR